MRHLAPIVVVAGVLALVVFLTLRARDAGPRVVVGDAGDSGIATASEPAAVPEPASAPAGATERTSVAPLAEFPGAEAATGWTVCVVDASTNAPIGAALVSVSDSQAVGRATGAQGIGADTLEGLRRRRELAVELETGPDGCVHFVSPPQNASVEARYGELWGFAQVNQPPAGGRVVLPIGPDRELRVRVVDGAGVPVGGVPVALRRGLNARPTYTWKWTDTEPSSGVATFFHFQRRLEQGTGWQALLAFPVRDERAIAVDARTPVEPPLELVLPETGRLLVRVRAADGSRPDLGQAELRLEAFDDAAQRAPLWPDGPWSTPRFDDSGDARVPWIGLGLFVRAALVRDDTVLAAASMAGPTRAGEEVLCRLDWLGVPPCVVTGRFVLADGRPWPATTVEAVPRLFPFPQRWPEPRDLAVDDQGRFRLQVAEPRPANGTRAIRFTGLHPDGLGEVSALVPLDQDVPADGLELGDVLFDFGERLASGRVVDEAGLPIRDAGVTVSARTVVGDEEFWPTIHAVGRGRTREDGAFTLHLPLGEASVGDELRLGASAEGYVDVREVDVQRGARDVEIVLTRAGALAGSLELDRGLAREDLVVYLQGTQRHGVRLSEDAAFDVQGLRPGTYVLDVWRRAVGGPLEREPAARIDALIVRAGETCRDPRVQGLRITGSGWALRIRVLDRASAPVARAAVSVVGRGDGSPVLTGADGVGRIRSDALPVDLEVSAFGFARRRVMGVSTDRDVVLDTGIPIRLHTDARSTGGEPPYVLNLMLSSVADDGTVRGYAWGREYAYDQTRFDERGDLALRMPAAGVYECNVMVTVLRPDRVGSGANVELVPKPRIVVHEGVVEQVFELAIPQAAIDRAVAAALR